MKPITGRQRLLLGALVVAGGIWLADSQMGGGQPKPAQAQSAAAAQGTAPAIVWQDVGPLLTRLTNTDYSSVAGRLEQQERDLFMPTPVIESALGPAAVVEEDDTQPAVDRAAQFKERHRLVGVLLGGTGWAVIDDRLYPLRAELDGYRLVAIERDRVVFADTNGGERLVLELTATTATP
ncbi:MAG: hypothetical protein AB1601_15890 [Planctomycetota bacterium]